MSEPSVDSTSLNEIAIAAGKKGQGVEQEIVRRKDLINKINYVNFLGQSLTAIFRHQTYGTELGIPVFPQPCAGDNLDCTWEDGSTVPGSAYTLQRLELKERDGTVHVVPESASIGEGGIAVALPRQSSIVVPDSTVRYEARNVSSHLIQNGIRLRAELLDYSTENFRLKIFDTDGFGYDLLNPDDDITLVIENGSRVVYSSPCKLSRNPGPLGGRVTTVTPRHSNTPRFPPKEYRAARHPVDASPIVHFRNPLSGIEMSYEVGELSGTGFSVNEADYDSRLITGLILFDARMVFADRKAISLTVQTVYREQSAEPGFDRCGMAILDISAEDHLAIISLLQRDKHSDYYLSTRLNIDDLWRFFFESGFIYPKKYRYISEIKDRLRETYEKLYCRPNDIARHFTAQRDSGIFGHLSMVRFYEKAWLIQHHASAAKEGRAAGMRVLQQVGRYANEAYRFRSMNLRFVMAYFRPENRFPARIFGGLEPFVENPQECSVDEFALSHIEVSPHAENRLPPLYSVDDMSEDDYRCLESFYARSSGGLLLEAMHVPPFGPGSGSESGMELSYRQVGIERSMRLLALHKNDDLVAVIVVNKADVGINLSELTNSITALVIDPASMPKEVFDAVSRDLAREYSTTTIPALVYPREAADTLGINVDRVYAFWIMRMTIIDKYFQHLNRFFRDVGS